MSKKNKSELKEFQLSVKVEAHYEVNIKAENFHDAVEKAKNLNGYELIKNNEPFDSSDPILWAVIDPSI